MFIQFYPNTGEFSNAFFLDSLRDIEHNGGEFINLIYPVARHVALEAQL
jgi:hypothetical protein